jgi:hypothetical protein
MSHLEIQLCRQNQQEEHQVVLWQSLDRFGGKQQRLLGVPGAEELGLENIPFSRSEPLQSQGSGQI